MSTRDSRISMTLRGRRWRRGVCDLEARDLSEGELQEWARRYEGQERRCL